MKYSEIRKVAPASMPVATINLHDHALDIYGFTVEDMLWLLSKSELITRIFAQGDQDKKAELAILALSQEAPQVMKRLFSIALGEPEETIDLKDFGLEDGYEIIMALFEEGVPEEMRPKLASMFMMLSGAMSMPNKSQKASQTSGDQ